MPTAILPDRSLIAVTGADAEHLMQNVITCDLDSLPQGVARAGALLTPQGKILFDFLIARDPGGGFTIDMRGDQVEAFTKRMTLYKLRSDMALSPPLETPVTISFGDDVETPQGALHDERFADIIVRRFPVKTGSVKADEKALAQWNGLRIEHGIVEGGTDYEWNDVFPHDVSLDQNKGVDFKKGCYVGQEVVSRMQHRGTARRRVMIARADKNFPPGGTEVTADGKSAAMLGTVIGNHALMIGRLDRVHEAIRSGTPLLAGDVTVHVVTLPPNVSYTWPENEQKENG